MTDSDTELNRLEVAEFNHLLEDLAEEETVVVTDTGISEEEGSVHSSTQDVFVHFRNAKAAIRTIQTRGLGTVIKPPIKAVMEVTIAHQDTTEALQEEDRLMVALTQALEHLSEAAVIQQEVDRHMQDAQEEDNLVAGVVVL